MANSDAIPRGHVVVTRDDDVVARRVGGVRLLVPIRAKGVDLGRVFTLNATGADAWDHFDGAVTLADIATTLGTAYGERPETILDDLETLVGELSASGLVTLSAQET